MYFLKITELLVLCVERNASDLHLSAGLAPRLRIDGELVEINDAVITSEQASEMLLGIMGEDQRSEYLQKLEMDFAYAPPGIGRFRVNVFQQALGIGAVFRIIPARLPNPDELGLGEMILNLTRMKHGLICVTGPAGSGKSTTLAALLDYINNHDRKHIITIEDPIEFTHESRSSLITQRSVGWDTLSFQAALRSALRQDPDIILVGEMRDFETVSLALTAAETGHLVFASLHTSSATKTVDRILDLFEPAAQTTIRAMLSESLQAVISQTLLKARAGGRIAAREILVATPAIRHLIREGKIAQIYSAMQTGRQFGMQTLDQHLAELVKSHVITLETAQRYARIAS